MVRFAFIVEGMSVTPRPVLWSGGDLEVEGPSWSGAVCHSIIGLSLLSLQAISKLCVTGKISSSLMWYPSCRLILTWPSSMTMPPAIRLVLCVISCKTGISVFCHGQRRARIGGWGLGLGLGPFPQEMSRDLQVPWWKSGVTSHSKNWQIWCSPWGGDALQYLNAAGGHTRYWLLLLILTSLCSRTHYSISVSRMSMELVQFVFQLLNLVMINQLFTHVKLAENKRIWQWEDVYFFAEFISSWFNVISLKWHRNNVDLTSVSPVGRPYDICNVLSFNWCYSPRYSLGESHRHLKRKNLTSMSMSLTNTVMGGSSIIHSKKRHHGKYAN